MTHECYPICTKWLSFWVWDPAELRCGSYTKHKVYLNSFAWQSSVLSEAY